MKFIIILLSISIVHALNVEKCPLVEIGNLKLHACKVKNYESVYFHDITGENRITIFPNRYYNNHGVIVAKTSVDTLYVSTEIYEPQQWIETFT